MLTFIFIVSHKDIMHTTFWTINLSENRLVADHLFLQVILDYIIMYRHQGMKMIVLCKALRKAMSDGKRESSSVVPFKQSRTA